MTEFLKIKSWFIFAKYISSWFHVKFVKIKEFYPILNELTYIISMQITKEDLYSMQRRSFDHQKFRQINVLLNNVPVNWFDGKSLHGCEFFVFPHYGVSSTMYSLFSFLFFCLMPKLIEVASVKIYISKIPWNQRIRYYYCSYIKAKVPTELLQTYLTKPPSNHFAAQVDGK